MQAEEWRPIEDAPGYEVSSLGRIGSWLPARNKARVPTERRIMKLGTDKDGYKRVALSVPNGKLHRRVPTLVCAAWHGSRLPGQVVRHLDGSKSNDTPGNLIWGTPLENSADSRRHGTLVLGSKVNTSKLSSEQVREVLSSNAGHSALARKFNVTPCAIWHIRSGRVWKSISNKEAA